MSSVIFVFGIPSALGVLALWTIIAIIRRRVLLIRELDDTTRFLADLGTEKPVGHLARAVQAHLVGPAPHDHGRYVLSRPLAVVRRDYAESEVAHARSFWFGSLLTGLALICTFALIAYVMINDVSGAIKNEGNAGQLSDAVSTLGGKFVISAAGIGGSVASLFCANWARAAIYRHAESPPLELLAAFTSVEAEELAGRLRVLEQSRADREERAVQHSELAGYLSSLNDRAQKLNSIEVSVQTIGNEVSANLKSIMKDAMAEQLREILNETMVQVSEIASSVQKTLTESLGTELRALAAQFQKSQEALQRAIEGQGQGQLDKLLDKLSHTVSGGFQAESQKMITTLQSFASVVPELAAQLATMTQQIASDTRRRAEEGDQQTRGLIEQVTALMASLESQQAANAQAVERVQAVSAQGVESIARRLETSGTGLVNNILSASRAEIEAISEQLRSAAQSSVTRYEDVEVRATNAAAAITQASNGLAQSAGAMLETANQTLRLLTSMKQGSDSISGASQHFTTAGNALLDSVRYMDQILVNSRAETQEQQRLLVRQQEFTKEVEKLWPQLFDVYISKFTKTSEELGSSWQVLHDKVKRITDAVGSTFADNTEALGDAVDRFVKATNGKPVRP